MKRRKIERNRRRVRKGRGEDRGGLYSSLNNA